jgi:hypothetical protein
MTALGRHIKLCMEVCQRMYVFCRQVMLTCQYYEQAFHNIQFTCDKFNVWIVWISHTGVIHASILLECDCLLGAGCGDLSLWYMSPIVFSNCSPFSCSKPTNILLGQWMITPSPLHIHLWPFSAPHQSMHLGLFHTPLSAHQLSTHLLTGYTLPIYPRHIPGFVILLRLLDAYTSSHHISSKHLKPLSQWHGITSQKIVMLKFNVRRICTH